MRATWLHVANERVPTEGMILQLEGQAKGRIHGEGLVVT